MRNTLRLFTIAAISLAMGLFTAVAAADYPERSVRLIVPFGAGGSTDIVGRIIAEPLSERLGQPITVDNRGGGGGTVGTAAAARADADGYTLSVGTTSTHVIGPLAHDDVGYDPLEDFDPISLVAITPYTLVVNKDLPVDSVEELIEYLEERPGELNMGSAGVGSTTHLAGEMFKDMTGTEMEHIPYRGNAPATTALMGDEIQVLFGSMPAVFSQIQAGEIKVLAVGTQERSPALPDTPTLDEAGVDGYEAALWLGYVAPAGTPDEIIEKLNEEIRAVVESDEVAERLQDNGAAALASTPEEYRERIESDTEKYRGIMQDIGLIDD